jgi:hypothetical protein
VVCGLCKNPQPTCSRVNLTLNRLGLEQLT